jgi:thiol-disulfide isomerase/thioredoxin
MTIVSLFTYAAPPTDLGTDLHGQPIRQLAKPGTRVLVLFFAASDCPISNRYVPEMNRLAQEFAAKSVQIAWVYPNPDETAALVAQHEHDYSISAEAILDPRQSLVTMAQATVTPEAAVFAVHGAQLHELYHGRVDDRYLDLGRERPEARHHDLEMAITAALGGKPVPEPGGPPVGCSIVFLQK